MRSLEQLFSPQAEAAFQARRDTIVQTIGVLGLRGITAAEDPALALGSGGAALQGIDMYIPSKYLTDLDVVVPCAMFERLESEGRFTGVFGETFARDRVGLIHRSATVPMPVDVLSSDSPDGWQEFTGGAYTGKASSTSLPTPEGVFVVPANVIAFMNAKRKNAEPKHLAGLVKAQIRANHTGHPIVENVLWRYAVGMAINRIIKRDFTMGRRRQFMRLHPAEYPKWLKELIKINFDHPAFDNIPKLRGGRTY